MVGNARPRALFLTQEFPWPLDRGGKIRAFQSLSALCKQFDVDVFAFSDVNSDTHSIEGFHTACQSVRTVKTFPHQIRLGNCRLRRAQILAKSYFKRTPYSLEKFVNRNLWALASELSADSFELIFVSHLAMFGFARQIAKKSRKNIPLILDEHNIENWMWRDFKTFSSFISRPIIQHEALRLSKYENDAWTRSVGVVSICEEDALEISSHVGTEKVVVFRPTVGTATISKRPVNRQPIIGLIGQWGWPPSGISLDWFLYDVVPALRSKVGQILIRLAGTGLNSSQARAAKCLGCEILGYVPDANEFYRSVDIIAAPDQTGGGVRLKVLNALAKGLPVAGTSISFRGLRIADGKNCLIAESGASLAAALGRLVADSSLRKFIGENASDYYREFHDHAVENQKFLTFVAKCLN